MKNTINHGQIIKNMHGVFDMINAAFMGSLISVQMSTDNRDFFGFEFGIPIDHAAGFIDRLIEFKCVDDDILKTLNSIIFPEFFGQYCVQTQVGE